MITLKPIGNATRKDLYYNDVKLGYVYAEVDGYYVFNFKEDLQGCWSDYLLRAIADTLTDLNKDWDIKINEYFSEQKDRDPYISIKTEENYNLLLRSGMFFEFHPELTGNWEEDGLSKN